MIRRDGMAKKPWITALFLALSLSSGSAMAAGAAPLAFPGAVGPAAQTPGGRGGKILRVTTLAPDGPGSLKAAIETPGARIIVFEVGGRSEEHTSELQSLMRISYAVFCLKKKKKTMTTDNV